MKILWNGSEWDYDPGLIDVRTGVIIKQHTGLGLISWSKAVDDGDPAAVQALLWAVQRQNGVQVDPSTLNFSIYDFMAAFNAAALVDMEVRVEAELRRLAVDPPEGVEDQDGVTPEPTPTSTTSETATSEPSATSST